MIKELNRLSASEVELLYKAPLLVSILIAGADGKIDNKEIKEAIKLAESKHKRSPSSVGILFKEVSTDFEDKLKILIQSYPYETTQRNPLIEQELSGLNKIWVKLDQAFSKEFYKTLILIAERIANSSGGWLGYKAIGPEEARYIKLNMINDPAKN